MTDLATVLAADRLVDLTQPLGPTTTLWPGSTPFQATTLAEYDTGPGYLRELQVPEHAGTHLDAPAHFSPRGTRVDAIPLSTLVRPAVKLDVRGWVNGDASARVDASMILELERVPARGAWLVAAPLKLVDGSGTPARVFAILPTDA